MNIFRRDLILGISGAVALRGADRVPVLVELFTSEGCSSCPPADQFLLKLAAQNLVPGVAVIPLSEHVDYWNRLGWKDPFSSAAYSGRQGVYAEQFRGVGTYTPQLVIDGVRECVGSDSAKALRLIAEAGRTPKSVVQVEWKDKIEIRIDGSCPMGKADVVLAITESNLSSNVRRGENSGRRLPHTAVTRSLTTIGYWEHGFVASQKVALDPSWKRTDLTAVVFAQDRRTRRISAAGSGRLG